MVITGRFCVIFAGALRTERDVSDCCNNKNRGKMTANWFEAKVKYMKVNEDGRVKKSK